MLHLIYKSYRMHVVLLACCLCLCFTYSAQNAFNYSWPIDSNFSITGNYGELRPNHFHTGLDFSTGGQINREVYTIQEGYVSRLRVNPGGYGKCIYITHPDGNVSVYAHLNSFSLKIGKLVKENQYATQNYEIDYLLKPRSCYVRKGEIIGLSGNTGSSTGPHLHFELRDQITEVPLNPLQFFKIKDHTSPILQFVAFYDLSDTTAPKFMNALRVKEARGDSLYLENDHLVLDQAIVGLAFSGFDKTSPNGNPNNIFSAKLFVDDRLVYAHKLHGIPFEGARYINEFSETIGKNKFQRCFMPTLYPSEMYEPGFNKGRMLISDSVFHKIRLLIGDESGNNSVLQFYIRTKKYNYYRASPLKSDVFVACNEDFSLSRNGFSLFIPAKTLYFSTPLIIENTLESNGRIFISPAVNLNQPARLGFKVPEKFQAHPNKLLLRSTAGTFTPSVRNDSVFFNIKIFDVYQLTVDTVPPKIKAEYSSRKLKRALEMDSFSFTISDSFSGIGRCNLWLNNSWTLAEYNPKTDLLTCAFDEDTPRGLLQFKVEVSDKVGNKTFFEYTLNR